MERFRRQGKNGDKEQDRVVRKKQQEAKGERRKKRERKKMVKGKEEKGSNVKYLTLVTPN